jgi:EmrB/QacA subfamily drug resistance transporter
MKRRFVASDQGTRMSGRTLVNVLVALLLTLFLGTLDQTIVVTALPRIIASLQGFDRYTWVMTAYQLSATALIPLAGRLSDQFGRKPFLLTGVALFLLGSALAGVSQSMDQLIAFRVIQGMGAGIGISLVFTMGGDLFPPAQRARWQGVFAGVYGLANLLGPALGGWLSDQGPLLGSLVTAKTRWHWIFYLNLPVGVVALLALLVYLPAHFPVRAERATGWSWLRRIDFAGAITVVLATTALLLGLTWGGEQTATWNSPLVLGTLAASGLLSGLFYVIERVAVEPVVPLDVFRNQVCASACGLALLRGMCLFGWAISLPLFFQNGLGISATNAGLLLLPFTSSVVGGAVLASMIMTASKRYQVLTVLATVVMTAGAFGIARMTASTSTPAMILLMVVTGIGLGVLHAVPTVAMQNAVPPPWLGVGTGLITYLSQLGAVLGSALVAAVVNYALSSEPLARLSSILESRDRLAAALQQGFLAPLVFCGIALVISFFLKDLPMEQPPPKVTAPTEGENKLPIIS